MTAAIHESCDSLAACLQSMGNGAGGDDLELALTVEESADYVLHLLAPAAEDTTAAVVTLTIEPLTDGDADTLDDGETDADGDLPSEADIMTDTEQETTEIIVDGDAADTTDAVDNDLPSSGGSGGGCAGGFSLWALAALAAVVRRRGR